MRKLQLFICILALWVIPTSAQLGIGISSPDGSAILDVSSTSKGVLISRLTQTQIDAIGSPVAGLTVFNTTENAWCTYDGTRWILEKRYVSNSVSLGDTITLGSFRLRIPASGNTSVQIALVSGSAILTGTSFNNYRSSAPATSGSATLQSAYGMMLETFNTTFKYWQSGLSMVSAGSVQEIHIMDETNDRMYKVRFIRGTSSSNNYVYLERLL